MEFEIKAKGTDNPFVEKNPIIAKSFKKRYAKKMKDTVDETNRAELGIKETFIDDALFVRVFPIGAKALKNATGVTRHLLYKIMYDMTNNCQHFEGVDDLWQSYSPDYIFLNPTTLATEFDSSAKSVSRAISCLIKDKVLAKGNANHRYWVNPHAFFNGNRINRYRDKVLVINDKFERELEQSKTI